jgi:hypothetical protein
MDDGLVVTLWIGPSPWDEYLGEERVLPELVASQRSTTSSKTPGKKNRGVIYSRRRPLVDCLKCGRKTMDFGEPHAPQFRDGRLVDCVGAVLR